MRKRLPIVKGDESGFTIAHMILGLVLSVCVVTLLLVVLIPRIGGGGNDRAGAKGANTGTSSSDSGSASLGPGHIFFERDRYSNGTLDASVWRINPDGSGPLKIASDGSNPVVSPDGKRVAYMRYEGNSDYALWVASSDGTGAKQLLDPDDWALESPILREWSPDGSILIRGGVHNTYSLYHVSEGGDQSKEKLSPETRYSLWGSLAPDGRLLYYEGSGDVYIRVPGAPSDSRLVLTTHGWNAVWTPDGRFAVVFSSEEDRTLLVYQVPPEGVVKLVRKIKVAIPRNTLIPGPPEVSPDGRWIVFQAGDCTGDPEGGCGSGGIWIVGIDGKGFRKLTEGYSPNWG